MTAKLNNRHLYPSPANQPRHLDKFRKEEAVKRQEAYDKLTPEQKLALLDEKQYAAKKQRAKLAAQISSAKAPKQSLVPSTVVEEIESLNQAGKRQHLKAKDRRKQEKHNG